MKQSTIIAVLFWAIVGIILCSSILSTSSVIADSDTANTLTVIGNATPTVVINSRTTPITLIEDGYTAIAWATATVSDDNGCDEVDFATSVVAVFYDSAAVATSCSSNGRNCYPNASTTCAVSSGDTCDGVGDTSVEWSCYVNPWHYSNDSADWKWYIAASDAADTGSSTSDVVTVSPLLALNVTETEINYGTLALDTLSNHATTTVENTGNDTALDVGVQENASFTCSALGTIAPEYEHFSQYSGFTYGDGTALWSTSTT
ncbi:MAG: hypothetical protein PHV47_02325, partial [Candidatus Pacebacteria bacterium]|nr:hypothetical protein [Candidatus Paceibacterota bacterium]